MNWSVRKITAFGVSGLALLSITVFVTWRIRLANDIKAEFAAIHAAGLPTNGEEANDYYPEVPDAENAAVKMEEAFELLTNYDDRRSNEVAAVKFPLPKTLLSAEQMELMTGYWAMNSNALACAREAIQLPHSRYPLDLSLGAATLLPHLAKLKTVARLAEFQTILNPDDSAVAIKTILGLAHTLDTEPVIISKLVRIALVDEARTICERRLNSGSVQAGELVSLGKMFDGAGTTNQIANGLAGERAMFAQYFCMSWADIKRFSAASDDDSSSQSMPSSKSQPFVFKLSGIFERDLRFYMRAMDTNILLAGRFPKDVLTISNAGVQIEQASRRNYYILSQLFLPALNSMTFKEAAGLAQVRMAQTAIAIERFRLANQHLPEKLDDLVPQFLPAVPEDPCDGNALRFRLLEKGYLIYSVGKDGQDNGGRERPADAKSSDKTLYDLTFTVER